MREFWIPPAPTGEVWKASEYRLVGDPSWQEYVEAAPGATWARVDPFRYYKPLANRSEVGKVPPPHMAFALLADMARDQSSSRRRTQQKQSSLYNSMKVFADVYGFLGFFREAFGPPILPARVDLLAPRVAPDALIGRDGKLRVIDPKTEGKRLLEELLKKRVGRWAGRRSMRIKRQFLTWPDELRFPALGLDGGEFGLLKLNFGQPSKGRTYDDVRERFGIRFVLDEHEGVSIIATREPLDYWLRNLETFQPAPVEPAYFDQVLEGVSPRAVANADGELASSWRCPSLLKAIYLMLYLDKTTGVRLQKCQDPRCSEYYRVPKRSRPSMYCPPPPGKKQSKCASRASSQMYRRRNANTT